MKTEPSSTSGSAIFIDIENVIGHCSALEIPVYIKPICEKIKEFSQIKFRIAFGDISKACSSVDSPLKIMAIRQELSNNLFDIQDIPHTLNSKNNTDIHIVTTALSYAYENKAISHFAFVANDRDYIPLYKKLREIGKIVTVVCIDRTKVSPVVIESVDNVFYYEDLFPHDKDDIVFHAKKELQNGKLEHETIYAVEYKIRESDLVNEYVKTALKAVNIIQNEKGIILGSDLVPKMKELMPDMDLKSIGVFKLKEFLELLQERGYIEFFLSDSGKGPVRIELQTRKFSGNISEEGALSGIYKIMLTNIINCSFPSFHSRKVVISKIKDAFVPYISLVELSNKILYSIDTKAVSDYENFVYKLLLSLFFGRAFHVQVDSSSKNNPTIISIKCTDEELFDKLSVNYAMSLIKHEQKLKIDREINPVAFSKLIYEDEEESNVEKCKFFIAEAQKILQTL